MNEPIVTIAIILANAIVTFVGFKNEVFLNRHLFYIKAIRRDRQILRFVSSGFLHADWFHLIFNMITLYSFGAIMEKTLGPYLFLAVYSLSLLAGNFLSYFVHRRNDMYRALGASGAVAGILFCSILFYPQNKIAFILIPIGIPAYLFGIIYTLYTIYGSIKQNSNIGHEAHLGGMLCGVICAVILYPQVLQQDITVLLAIGVPMLAYLYFIFKK